MNSQQYFVFLKDLFNRFIHSSWQCVCAHESRLSEDDSARGIMNPASVLMWANTETLTWKVLLTYYVTGFPLDCVHAAATAFFLWIAAEPMLEKLDRIKLKYGLME